MKKSVLFFLALVLGASLTATAADKPRKLVIIAGKQSHGPGDHEFRAGCLLFQKCLANVRGLTVEVHTNGWINTPNAFDGADAVFIYADGGAGHPAIQGDHLEVLRGLISKGVGFGCAHYGVEILADKGGKEFQDWIGGYYENAYSVNPMWSPDYTTFPKHPITRGVQPFSNKDEWYFNMRFREDMKDVTPILVAKPSDAVRDGPYVAPKGPYPHIQAAKGREEVMMWAMKRPDGGRGFGFTGGHTHAHWSNDNQRKILLNALLWIAKLEVPDNGVESKVTEADMAANLDPKTPRKPAAAPAAPVPTASGAPAPKYKSGLVTKGTVQVDADIKGAKNLYLVVTDGGNGFSCDWSDWAEPQLTRADGSKIKLTELKWKTAAAGWGKAIVGRNVSGGALQIAGKTYDYGIGTHAPSLIHFELPEDFVRFTATVGLDNGGTDQNGGAQVEFQVFTEPPSAGLQEQTSGINSLTANRAGPEAAKAFVKSLKVANGLDVGLFASEPMVVNPCDMDIDERGRVWITEGANYRSTFQKWGILRPGGDRIQILEDTNNDGVADKATTFYQDPTINSALGICVLGNKVIVSSSPHIFVLTDSNNDGKADKRELLFTDIKGADHDHAVHAFVFGPDGKLYFNFGNAGKQLRRPSAALKEIPLNGEISKDEMTKGELVVDLAGNRVTDQGKPYRQGMVFRCDLDGSNIETLGWNFRNNYEVAVDSFGTLWQSDNDDDGNRGVRINYVMEFGNFGYTDEITGANWGKGWEKAKAKGAADDQKPYYHWYQNDPGVVPNLLQTGAGSPTGILVYEGKLLPEAFRNQVIHCDAGPRTVRAYPAKNSGAGYSAEMADILTSTDSWYRPADVCVAPDGSLYIADWNDAGVGGHNMVERSVETMTGRIYRVAPKGSLPVVNKPDYNSAAGCVAALQSPNQATRYLAWMKLHEMQGAAEAELLKLWNGNDTRQKSRALNLLARIRGSERKYVETALRDADANIRIAALRIVRQINWGEVAAKTDTKQAARESGKKALIGALNQALQGGKVDAGTTAGQFLQNISFDTLSAVRLLVNDPSPQVRRECAIALRHNSSLEAPKLWAQLAQQHDGKDRWYLEALGIGADRQWDSFFTAWREAAGDKWNSAAGRDIVWRSRSKETPALLVKLISDKATPANERDRYFRAMDFQSGPEKDAALLQLLTVP